MILTLEEGKEISKIIVDKTPEQARFRNVWGSEIILYLSKKNLMRFYSNAHRNTDSKVPRSQVRLESND